MKGTFRHYDCLGAVKHDDKRGICKVCLTIPSLQSFRRRLQDRPVDGRGDLRCIRFDRLTHPELLQVVRKKNEKIEQQRSKLFFARGKILNALKRKRTLTEQVKEMSRRGDLRAVANKIVQAGEEGKLKEHNVLTDLLHTVSHNFHVSEKGRRFKASVKHFYEVILTLGGPQLANFVSINLDGPGMNTLYDWRAKGKVKTTADGSSKHILLIAKLYGEIKEKLAITEPVPVLLAEDETAIKQEVSYHQATDQLLGFCGRKTEASNHVCMAEEQIVVGNDDQAYEGLVATFEEYEIGSYARVILINPLNPQLPKLPLLIKPTCNKFDHETVFEQWEHLGELYEENLEEVIGPLIGHSSDGDARRRKCMLELMNSNDGDRFQPIPADLGFMYSAAKTQQADGSYTIKGLGDQDFIHEHKKLINPLDHRARVMMLNNHIVHMNHLELVTNVFDKLEHGLTRDHLLRRDRQNWKVA